jgi:hypothetical protein
MTGTPQFMSPEMMTGGGYGAETDMWSLGITLIQLCDGINFNRPGENLRKIFLRIISEPAPSLLDNSKWSPELSDFLDRCLVKEVSERATCRELLLHPWIAEAVERIERYGYSSCLRQHMQENLSALLLYREEVTKSIQEDPRVVALNQLQRQAERELHPPSASEVAEEEATRLKLERKEEEEEEARLAREEAARLKQEEDLRLEQEEIRLTQEEESRLRLEKDEEAVRLKEEEKIHDDQKCRFTAEAPPLKDGTVTIQILPTPGVVLKTRSESGNKVFVNVCSHPRLRTGCWSSFYDSRELADDDPGMIYDICCDELLLQGINDEGSQHQRNEVRLLLSLSSLNT